MQIANRSPGLYAQRNRQFLPIFSMLAIYYAFWIVIFWPGHLGEDSLAIILDIKSNGSIPSGKTSFWYYFVKIIATQDILIQFPIIFQAIFTALVFARILGWIWQQRMRSIFYFCLFFICLTPHMVAFSTTLYPDAIFAVAAVGLIFELWLCLKKQEIRPSSYLLIILLIPFACFSRTNGIIFLMTFFFSIAIFKKKFRLSLLGIGISWSLIAVIAGQLHNAKSHGMLFPLVAFETANFLQPHPMNLWREQPRVTDKTIESLTRRVPLEIIIKSYDPDYWDPLEYQPDGPRITSLSRQDKKIIIREFFLHNLWQNIPSFIASRVNVFLVAALAQGGQISLAYTENVLSRTETGSKYRPYKLSKAEEFATAAHQKSEKYRWLLWSPFIGFFLLFCMIKKYAKTKDAALLFVAAPMLIQLLAIFTFSIAGEYRYLLVFFIFPIAALPILSHHSTFENDN